MFYGRGMALAGWWQWSWRDRDNGCGIILAMVVSIVATDCGKWLWHGCNNALIVEWL